MSDDPNARNTDPYTSKLAGAGIRAEKKKDLETVWREFKLLALLAVQAGLKPETAWLADFQLEARLDGARNGKWRKRRSDLKDQGLLEEKDQIRNPHTGKLVNRWGLTEKALAALALAASSPPKASPQQQELPL